MRLIFSRPARRILFVLAASLALRFVSFAEEFYQNPVIPGDHPDPSIIRVGGDFWATCTSSEWGPQFPLFHSKDLVNWELTGAVFTKRPAWASENFWAPEISEWHGHYAVYYAARKRGGPISVAVAMANNPGGPYTDNGVLVSQEDGSIDPAPATDEDGQRWLIWKEDGNSRRKPSIIWAQRLNDQGTKVEGESHELIRNDAEWEGGVVEGPFILRHNGWFYLFYSGNGCCGGGCTYALGVARSRALLGPWEKNPMNPILAADGPWKCPGHGSVVEDGRGRFFFLYHAYSTNGFIYTGREAMLDEVRFGPDNWPTINNNNGPSASAPSPFGAAQRRADNAYAVEFASGAISGRKLDPGWQWPQNREPRYTFVGDGLRLLPSAASESNYLAVVLARPTPAADYVATTRVVHGPAGLCAIGDLGNALGAVVRDDSVILWRRDHGAQRQLAKLPRSQPGALWLRLTADHGNQYELAYSVDGELWLPAGDPIDAKDLPPWDRGMRVALTAGGGADAVEGTFSSFSLRPLAGSDATAK